MAGLREQVVEIKQEVDEDLEDVDSEEQNCQDQMDEDWKTEGQEFTGLSTKEKRLLHREQDRQRKRQKRASLTENEIALRRQKDAERKRELRAMKKCATPCNIPVSPKKEPRLPLPEEEIALRRKREADRKRERRAQSPLQKRGDHSEIQEPTRKKSRLPLTEDKDALRRKREAERKRKMRSQLPEEEKALRRKIATERQRELRRARSSGILPPPRVYPRRTRQENYMDVTNCLRRAEDKIRDQEKLALKKSTFSINESETTKENLLKIRALKMSVGSMKMAGLEIIRASVKYAVEFFKDKQQKADFSKAKIGMNKQPVTQSGTKGYKRRAPDPNSYQETLPIPFNKANKSFICFACNCEFEALSGIKLHLPSHSASELLEAQQNYQNAANRPKSKTQNIIFHVFTCELCSEKSYSIDYYRKHIIEKHKDNKEILAKMCFPCSFCPEVFTARHVLMIHLKKSHDIFTQCPICNENFKSHNSFARHLEIHSDADLKNENKSVFEYGDGYFCKTCGYCSRSYSTVNSHVKEDHEKPIAPETGTKGYKRRAPEPNSYKVKLPIPFNSRNKSFVCFVCNCEFKALKGIKEHLPSHTSSELSEGKEKYSNSVDPPDKKTQEIIFTVYTCEICSDTTYSIFYYRKHIIEKHKDNKEILSKVCFPCSFCPEVTTARHLLKIHLEKCHHMFTQCPICNENFETQASFAIHLEIHSDADLKNENKGVFEFEDGYFCKTCGYCSRSYNTVATHIKENCCDEAASLEKEITGYKRRAPVPNSYKETLPVPCNKENGSHTCFVCNCEFEALSGLKLHLPSHTAAELLEAKEKYENAVNAPNSETQNIIFQVFPCEICSDKSYSFDCYKNHLIENHKDNKEILSKHCFPCPFCPEVSFARNVLMMHLTKFHDIFTQCPICDENFKTQASFVNHIEIHTDADLKNKNERVFEYKGGFFCKTCGFCSTSSYKMVATHIKEDHSEEALSLECTICNFTYESKKALRRHQRDAHAEEIFFCEICGKELKSALSLKNHKKSHSRNSNKKEVKRRITCQTCGKTFANKNSFQAHDLATHQSRKVFQCNICGEAFSYYTALLQHKVTVCENEKAKRKPCPICGKVLANYLLLSHHKMNFHKYGNTQENVCHVCDRTFKDSFNLYIHNNAKHAHTEPLTCAYCKKISFSNKLQLLAHWRTHQDYRPYKCNVCGMDFKSQTTFYRHKRNKHSDELDDVKLIVDYDLDRKLRAEFHAAHESQLIKTVNQEKDCTPKIPAAYQSNVNTITQNVPLEEDMADFGSTIDDYLETNIIKDCSIAQRSFNAIRTNNINKNYIDFSRANIPEMRLHMPQESADSGEPTEPEIKQVTVQENIPKGTAPFEEDENGFSTMEPPFPINEYYTSDLPSPMEPPSPMEQSENDEDGKEKKPFVCAADVIPADPFPKRLMVVIERLRACGLCNDVFPSMAVYREHMKSKSHRVAQRAKKREEIVDRDMEESEEEDLGRKKKKVRRNKKQSSDKKYKQSDLIYPCAFCPEKFPSVNKYRKHRLQHLKRATCLNCSEKFVGDRELVSHYISEHKEEHIIKCEHCGKGFLDYKPELLRMHVRRQHLNQKQKRSGRKKHSTCDICGERMVGKRVLGQHTLLHNEDKNKCVHCPEEFQGYTDLENHYEKVHNGDMPFPCEKCPQKFLTQYRLLLHEEYYHGRKREIQRNTNGRFPCPFCNDTFTILKTYTQHVKHHKATSECLLCPQKYTFSRKLVDHYISDHDGQKLIRCEICDKAFLDYKDGGLEGHIQRMHQGKKRKQTPACRFPCDICGEKLRGLKLLKAHLLKHNEEKQKCVHCTEEFDGVNALENHYKKIHDGDMPFQCTECPMKFSIEFRLEGHKKTEHREKIIRKSRLGPAMCDICGLVIKNGYFMDKHKEKHADKEERQKFFCEYCGKSYLNEYTLLIHRRKHTGENPYPCTICEGAVAFYTIDLLNCHMRRVHNSFTCDICGESFVREKKLTKHRETHKSDPN